MNRAAQALGRRAKGVPKNYTRAELARRKERLAQARERWYVERALLLASEHLDNGDADLAVPVLKRAEKIAWLADSPFYKAVTKARAEAELGSPAVAEILLADLLRDLRKAAR